MFLKSQFVCFAGFLLYFVSWRFPHKVVPEGDLSLGDRLQGRYGYHGYNSESTLFLNRMEPFDTPIIVDHRLVTSLPAVTHYTFFITPQRQLTLSLISLGSWGKREGGRPVTLALG